MGATVHIHTSGFDLQTFGVILPVVGIIGAVLSLPFWGGRGGAGLGVTRRRTTI
ncbi:MAG: hypothetical protein ACRDYC_07545 [Acidimicrobiales bacterium]